jgi:hypothetical protein
MKVEQGFQDPQSSKSSNSSTLIWW